MEHDRAAMGGAQPVQPVSPPCGTLAPVTRRLSRFPVAVVFLFLTLDLVDGPTPGPSGRGVAPFRAGHTLDGSSSEAHDAEFFCARATVVGPVLLTAGAAVPELLIAPKTRRPALGFPALPFHPPRRSF